MTTLPPRQIGAVIAETGAFGIDLSNPLIAVPFLDTAIAVCLAESGGNTQAKNKSSSASGLWQIMVSVHGALIRNQAEVYRMKKGRTLDVFDPHVNTGCAGQLYKERGWQPWVAYTSGSYKKHSGHGTEAYNYLKDKAKTGGFDWSQAKKLDSTPIDGDSLGRIAENTASSFSPGAAVDKALNFAKDAGIAIGVFLLGVIVLVLGAWFIVSQSPTVKRAASKATDLVPVKRLVK